MRKQSIPDSTILTVHEHVTRYNQPITLACQKFGISRAIYAKRLASAVANAAARVQANNGADAGHGDTASKLAYLEKLCVAQAKLLAAYGLRVDLV